ncbi:MAG: tetratricopeptide repeat protein [Chitinophagaceae bacterium]|nr:tetratricopeptide repeat protein [Chitinophagaceae bacterium]
MKKLLQDANLVFLSAAILTLLSCGAKNNNPKKEAINAINLKRGDLVLCGKSDNQLGTVAFESSCSEKGKKDFNLGIALLHSFEYDEAEKVFAKIIDEDPECAMAYWGVAMSNYHPLWAPPTLPELEKGAKAIAIAQSLTKKSKKESAYIDAIGLFYKDWNKTDHRTRAVNFEKAMEKLHTDYPNDGEVAIFYALALDAAADPADKSFNKQRKAGAILTALYPNEPNHPGIVHYIIHSYDYPELAALALPSARKYASIAPSSAHAQHMPSHIFTRLGLWDECIHSNLVSTSSARCYAEKAGIKGHWDEELHALDYLVYAYLQKAENTLAKEQYDYLKTIHEVHPPNFKVAYAFASIPARYLLENKNWKEAASLTVHPADFPWEKFPWQKAIIHLTRVLGSVHTGNINSALTELKSLQTIHDTLMEQKDVYKANQVRIQIQAAEAWVLFKQGKPNEALKLMNAAADMEDETEKHPVTPGEIIPARELLGDLLLQMNKPEKALEAYEANLKKHPNRFNGLYGAAVAAEKYNNLEKATTYYQQLTAIANSTGANRPELDSARMFLKKQNPNLGKVVL